jgi:GNAT superfamily N-acetyltransferase
MPLVNIRKAKQTDHEQIVHMAMKFLALTRYGVLIRGVTLDSMRRFVELVFDMGVIFVADINGELIGMLGLIVVQHPMSGTPEAAEVAWWIEPEHRTSRTGYYLLCQAEEWARQKGLMCLKMVAPADSQTGPFYEHMGYQAVETVYQKFLDTPIERKVATLTNERLNVAQ